MTDDTEAGESGMRIEADLVRQLAELLTENGLTEIEVEDGTRRIVVKREITVSAAPMAAPQMMQATAATAATPITGAVTAPSAHPGAVKSPMVGTVYLSGEPGSRPFVSVGDTVKEGDTLVIVEAMKVMNPILSPRTGTISDILVVNSQPVEFDQPLVIIE